MRIFEYEKAEFSKNKSKIFPKKVHFFAYLARNFATLSVYSANLFTKLFPRDRSLACRIYHDDYAVCTNIVFHFIAILAIPKGEKSLIAIDRAFIGL